MIAALNAVRPLDLGHKQLQDFTKFPKSKRGPSVPEVQSTTLTRDEKYGPGRNRNDFKVNTSTLQTFTRLKNLLSTHFKIQLVLFCDFTKRIESSSLSLRLMPKGKLRVYPTD